MRKPNGAWRRLKRPASRHISSSDTDLVGHKMNEAGLQIIQAGMLGRQAGTNARTERGQFLASQFLEKAHIPSEYRAQLHEILCSTQ